MQSNHYTAFTVKQKRAHRGPLKGSPRCLKVAQKGGLQSSIKSDQQKSRSHSKRIHSPSVRKNKEITTFTDHKTFPHSKVFLLLFFVISIQIDHGILFILIFGDEIADILVGFLELH